MLVSILSALLLGLGCVLCAFDPLHMFQLESYQLPGYFRWMRENPGRAFLRQGLPTLAAAAALLLCSPRFQPCSSPSLYTCRSGGCPRRSPWS